MVINISLILFPLVPVSNKEIKLKQNMTLSHRKNNYYSKNNF